MESKSFSPCIEVESGIKVWTIELYIENSSFLGQMTRKVDFIFTLQKLLSKKQTVMIIELSLFKDRH